MSSRISVAKSSGVPQTTVSPISLHFAGEMHGALVAAPRVGHLAWDWLEVGNQLG